MTSRLPAPVLFVDNSFTFGGAINALAYLVSAMDRSRYQPLLLSAQPADFLAEYFPDTPTFPWKVKLPWVDDGVHRRVVRLPGFGTGPLRTLWDKTRTLSWLALYDVPEALWIARLARTHGARAIHLNNGVESMVSSLIAGKLLRIPVIAHARGPQSTSGMAARYARMCDEWISVTRHVADNIAQAGVDRAHITVVHDAIDLSRFEEGPPPPGLRAHVGVPDGSPIFGVFARIIPWKGIREFVAAARLVIDQVPNAYAMVVGDPSDGDAEYYAEVQALARQLGIEDRVIFAGFQKDVGAYMRLCDVCVHTSIFPEPFGMTVIEAMASGRPIVAASIGGPVEILEPGKTGLLAHPSKPEEMSAAIVSLLRDRATAEAMGKKAAERARAYYSAARYAQEVQQVYDRVGVAN